MPINKLPHRRVLLTQPSAAVSETLPTESATMGAPGQDNGDGRTTRVIAYLTPDEAQQLEQVWLQMRAMAIRPSKADIMRAALILAINDPDGLGTKLKEQMGQPTATVAAATAALRK